jgi:hypothetical protein
VPYAATAFADVAKKVLDEQLGLRIRSYCLTYRQRAARSPTHLPNCQSLNPMSRQVISREAGHREPRRQAENLYNPYSRQCCDKPQLTATNSKAVIAPCEYLFHVISPTDTAILAASRVTASANRPVVVTVCMSLLAPSASAGTHRAFPELGVDRLCHRRAGHSRP